MFDTLNPQYIINNVSIDGTSSMERHLANINDADKGYTSLCLQVGFSITWSYSGMATLIKFLRTCQNIRSLILRGMDDFHRDDYATLRKCVVAAKLNQNILHIEYIGLRLEDSCIQKATELILIGGNKIKKLFLCRGQSVVKDEMQLLNMAVASLCNLEHLDLSNIPNESFLDLVTNLGKVTNPSLQKFSFGTCEDEDEDEDEIAAIIYNFQLEGIDSFLASVGAARLEYIDFYFPSARDTATKRLVSGLERNTSIRRLSITADTLTKKFAVVLSDFIRKDVKNLTRLDIDYKGSKLHVQSIILPALFSNTSIRKLYLHNFFLDTGIGENISELLIRNKHIEELQCGLIEPPEEDLDLNEDPDLNNTFLKVIAQGILQNQTLKKLTVNTSSWQLDCRPIFDVIQLGYPPTCSLEKLEISGESLSLDCARSVSAAIANPNCHLKSLRLVFDYFILEGHFQILSTAALPTTRLQELEICFCGLLEKSQWEKIISMLPDMALTKLRLETKPSYPLTIGGSVTQDICEQILQGVNKNQSFEDVSFNVNVVSANDISFHSKLREFCNRNVTLKAINALTHKSSCSTVGNLPLSALPHVLGTLKKRCKTTKDYMMLLNTILFSILRTKHETWNTVFESIGMIGRKRQMEQTVNNNTTDGSKQIRTA